MSLSPEIDSLAEALIEANDQLVGLYDLADVTAQSLDENELVVDILERAVRIVRAECLSLTTPQGCISVGTEFTGLRAKQASSTSVEARHGSGLTGELRASKSSGDFSTGDRKLLSAVLRTTLTAVETARLHQRALTSALDEQERLRAAEVAQLALPAAQPDLDGVDFFFRTSQARQTGGDLITYQASGDRLMFAVGDVAGKGLPAAVVMTTAVCAVRAAFRDRTAQRPGQQISLVSEWMLDHLTDVGVFISMFIGHYDLERQTLSWANAGHSPCLASTSGAINDLEATSPPIGVLPITDAVTHETVLGDGDLVVIGSDGLTEQTEPSGEPFGEARLHGIVDARLGLTSAELGHTILHEVSSFAGSAPQSDDRTLVLLRPELTQ